MGVALITGIGGFVGQWLAQHLLQRGESVVGLARGDVAWHVAGVADKVQIERCDLREGPRTREVIWTARPDTIYHLAALSSPLESRADPERYLHNNVESQVNLLEAMRSHASHARMLVVSSANVYGSQPERAGSPFDEDTPLLPGNPYAQSKVEQERVALRQAREYSLDIVIVRPFNHSGPGQRTGFVVPDIAAQIAAIEVQEQPPVVTVQTLKPSLDITDVRDVARAYHLAVQAGVGGEVYNVGSGRAWSVSELVDFLCGHSTVQPIDVQEERPDEPTRPAQICDSARLATQTGWHAEIPIETTLVNTLDYWRRRSR